MLILLTCTTLLADTIAVPLPDAAAELVDESPPWGDPAASHPPLAWSTIGTHTIGDAHVLFDETGAVALRCTVQSFALHEALESPWSHDGVAVWAVLRCPEPVLALR